MVVDVETKVERVLLWIRHVTQVPSTNQDIIINIYFVHKGKMVQYDQNKTRIKYRYKNIVSSRKIKSWSWLRSHYQQNCLEQNYHPKLWVIHEEWVISILGLKEYDCISYFVSHKICLNF